MLATTRLTCIEYSFTALWSFLYATDWPVSKTLVFAVNIFISFRSFMTAWVSWNEILRAISALWRYSRPSQWLRYLSWDLAGPSEEKKETYWKRKKNEKENEYYRTPIENVGGAKAGRAGKETKMQADPWALLSGRLCLESGCRGVWSKGMPWRVPWHK